eukprot:2205789-Rhodomonas_salina.3
MQTYKRQSLLLLVLDAGSYADNAACYSRNALLRNQRQKRLLLWRNTCKKPPAPYNVYRERGCVHLISRSRSCADPRSWLVSQSGDRRGTSLLYSADLDKISYQSTPRCILLLG